MNIIPSHVLRDGSREPTAEETAVLQSMHTLSQACLNASRSALAALTAPALTYSHTDGRIQNREEFIDALESKKSVFRGIELKDVFVQVAGLTALVTHHAIYSTFNRGEACTSDVQVIQIWQRDGDTWHLLLRQACKTPSTL